MCELNENGDNLFREIPDTGKNIYTISGSETRSERKERVSFDVALTETKFGKFNYFVIALCGVTQSTSLIEVLGLSFVLPVSDCDLNFSNSQKGFLAAVGYIGIIVSSQLWGFLADTKGRRRIIIPTLILAFIFTLISSFMSNFWLLVITRFLNGFLMCASSSASYAYLGEFHATKTRSKAFMASSVVFSLGDLILPAVAWVILNQSWSFYIPIIDLTYKPWRLFMVLCGVPELICALCMYKLPESPKFVLLQDKHEETIQILQKVYAINTGRMGTEYPVKAVYDDDEGLVNRIKPTKNSSNPIINALKTMWNQTVPLFQSDLLKKIILVSILQFGFFYIGYGVYMWLPNILNQIGEYSHTYPEKRASICGIVRGNRLMAFANGTEQMSECKEYLDISAYEHSFVLEILYAIGFVIMGAVVNKVGKNFLIFVLAISSGICGIAAVYVKIPILATYLFIMLMVSGCGITIVNAVTVELFPTSLRAMAVCISLMAGRLGSVVGSNITGILLEHYCEGAYLACGILLICCGFIAYLIPEKSKENKVSQAPRLSIVSLH